MKHVSISEIRLSRLNEKIYRPIRDDDPEIIALAKSIRENGLLKPLVISQDGYLLDGHRRRVACRLANVNTVQCEVKSVTVNDPEFRVLLREYNRQRVKGIDEVIREEIIDTTDDDEEIDLNLLKERVKKSKVNVDSIEIVGTKTRAEIKGNKPLLDAAIKVIYELKEFWPLSDRTIHYRLLNDPPLKHSKKSDSVYKNDKDSYNTLTNVLTRGRLTGDIPWETIGDETRPVVIWTVHPDITPFVGKQMDRFMKGYFRDYLQSQPNQIEIVGEKLTIDSIIRPIAMDYCIPFTIGRGYSSLDPRYQMAERFRKSGKKNLVILLLSDFDPDGDEIAHSFARSMRDDFDIENIHAHRVAVTKEQITRLKLSVKQTAKKGSSNYEKFVTKHGGKVVFELEAIPPKELQTILRKVIDAVINFDLFNQEKVQEQTEQLKLREYRTIAMEAIGKISI
jgi:hypothetical protein